MTITETKITKNKEKTVPSNATHATWATYSRKYARKYVTNVADVVDGTARHCFNNYSQPPPLLGRMLLQFNAAQRNEFLSSATKK